ncbi:MAG: hybrid sensor histidine kinase/response regulator, partial [Actinomycetota bacterium]
MWQQPAPLFRTLTLGQRFAAVSAGLAGLAILVIGLTAWTLASQELERHHRSSLRQEGSLVAERVGGQLRAMAASMEALSRNSLLANALVDTFGKETYLLPFLSSVRQVDGIPVDILFADFEGNPIATNGTTPFGPDEMAWLTATIGGGRSRAEVRDGPEGPMVLAAELMFYSRTPTPEGALMYRFPLSSLMGHGAAR